MKQLVIDQVEAILGNIESLKEHCDLDELDEFSERSSLGFTLMTGITDMVDLVRIGGEGPLADLIEHIMDHQEWESHEINRFGRKNWKAAPDQRGGWYVVDFEKLDELIVEVRGYIDQEAKA